MLNFVHILIIFLLIQRLYDSKYARNDRWLLIPSKFVWFHCDYICKIFLPFWKVNFCLFHQFFQKCSKNSWKDCWTACIESYRLRFKSIGIQLWILTLLSEAAEAVWGQKRPGSPLLFRIKSVTKFDTKFLPLHG